MKKLIAERAQEADLSAVYELDLHNAHLSSLDLDITACSKLKMLDISFNVLPSLQPEIFSELTTLVELKAYSNQIDHIGTSLRACVKLESLHLQNNSLTVIDGFQTLAKLKTLLLESNHIPTIVNLNCNRNLQVLDLSRNQIRKIQGLEELVNLQELRLAHNHISIIEGLTSLTNLVELDLSHNEIATTPSTLPTANPWRALRKLQILRLSGNRMTSLALLWPMPSLEELYLQGNCFSLDADHSASGTRPFAAFCSSPSASFRSTTPSTPSHRDGSSSPFLTRISMLAPNLQILDVSNNGSHIITSYSDLSTLLKCSNLVELSIKGSCHYEDRRTHCTTVQSFLPNLEVLDGEPITAFSDTLCSTVGSRGSIFFSPTSSATPLFQRVAPPSLGNSVATPRTPGSTGFGMVTFDSRRPGSARSTHTSLGMSCSFGSTTQWRQPPVMRPHSARTGGFDRVWTLDEANSKHQDFMQSLGRLRESCELHLQNMHQAYAEVFPPSPAFSSTLSARGNSGGQPDKGTGSGHDSARPSQDISTTPPQPEEDKAPIAQQREPSVSLPDPVQQPIPAVQSEGPTNGRRSPPAPMSEKMPVKSGPKATKRASRVAKSKALKPSQALEVPTASTNALSNASPAEAVMKRTLSHPLVLSNAQNEAAVVPSLASTHPKQQGDKKRPTSDPGTARPFLPVLPPSPAVTGMPVGGQIPPAQRLKAPPRASRRGSDGDLLDDQTRKAKGRSISTSALFRFTPTVLAELGPKLGVHKNVRSKAPHHLPASQCLRQTVSPPHSPPLPISPTGSDVLSLSAGSRVRTPPFDQPPLPWRPSPLPSETDLIRTSSSPSLTRPHALSPPGTVSTKDNILSQHAAKPTPKPPLVSCETQTGDTEPVLPRSHTNTNTVQVLIQNGSPSGPVEMSCQTNAIVLRLPLDTILPPDRPLIQLGAEDDKLPEDDSDSSTESDEADDDSAPSPAVASVLEGAGDVAMSSVGDDALSMKAVPVDQPKGRSMADGSADMEGSTPVDVNAYVVATLGHCKGQVRGPIMVGEKQGYFRFATPRQSTSFDSPKYKLHPNFQRPQSVSGFRPSSARSQRLSTPATDCSRSPGPSLTDSRGLVSAQSTRSSHLSEKAHSIRRSSAMKNLNRR